MRPLSRIAWLAAACGVVGVAAQDQREHSYPATLTPGDGVLLFSPTSDASAWTLSNSSSNSSQPSTSPGAAGSDFVASTNATNATASFAFYGSSFNVLGSGNGELQVSVIGFADMQRDPRRSPDWDSPHHDNSTHPNRTREIKSTRYVFNATAGGVLYSDNSTDAEWKNVTVQLTSGAVAIEQVQVTHRVNISANQPEEAPLLTLPAVWWGNGSLNGGQEIQFYGPWEAKNLTSGKRPSLAAIDDQMATPSRDTPPP